MSNIIQKTKHIMMKKSREKKFSEFITFIKPNKDMKILDVGVANQEHSPYDNFLEKKYFYPEQITALSTLPLDKFKKRHPEINAITYGGGKFPFDDKEFDVVHSNAVIEHVGDHLSQVQFLKEIVRVGKKIYITTPDKYFPIEMHTNALFLHWLPKQIFHKYLNLAGKGYFASDNLNLLSIRTVKKLLKEAGCNNYRINRQRMLGLPMHITIYAEV